MVTDSIRDKTSLFKKTRFIQSFYHYNFFQRIVGVIHSDYVVRFGFAIDDVLHYAGEHTLHSQHWIPGTCYMMKMYNVQKRLRLYTCVLRYDVFLK